MKRFETSVLDFFLCVVKTTWKNDEIWYNHNKRKRKNMEIQGEIYFDSVHIPYRFDEESGKLTMYFGLQFIECESSPQKLTGNSLGKGILFFLSVPLSSENLGIKSDKNILCGTITVEVKFYIEDFDQNIKYNTMYFEFRELDNLLPSKNAAIYDANTKQWEFENQCIKDFDFIVMQNNVKFELFNSYSIGGNLAYDIKTKSYIKLFFLSTDDFSFLTTLFIKIKELFMLIYNRQNINLFSVDLFGLAEQVSKSGLQTAGSKQRIYKSCLKYIAENHLGTAVSFLGAVNQKQIGNLINSSDINVCTSNLETFGRCVFEGMFGGLPTVIFNKLTCVGEFVKNGEGIFFVQDENEFCERVVQLLQNDEMYNKQSIRAIESTDFISSGIESQRLKSVVERVMGAKNEF